MRRGEQVGWLVVTTHAATYWQPAPATNSSKNYNIKILLHVHEKRSSSRGKTTAAAATALHFFRLDTQIRSTVAGVLNWHEPATALRRRRQVECVPLSR